jgi:hypothetical protein
MNEEVSNEKRVFTGTITLTIEQREALKNCASDNVRKMGDQMRLYILDGLRRDGYLSKE